MRARFQNLKRVFRHRFWCSDGDFRSIFAKFGSKTTKFRSKIVFPTTGLKTRHNPEIQKDLSTRKKIQQLGEEVSAWVGVQQLGEEVSSLTISGTPYASLASRLILLLASRSSTSRLPRCRTNYTARQGVEIQSSIS